MAETSRRKRERGETKGEARRQSKGGEKPAARRKERQSPQVKGEPGGRKGKEERSMTPALVAQEIAEQSRAVMAKAEDENRRIAREATRQAEEMTSRSVPWWGGMWGMWDAMDMARGWMGLTWRMWDAAASAFTGGRPPEPKNGNKAPGERHRGR